MNCFISLRLDSRSHRPIGIPAALLFAGAVTMLFAAETPAADVHADGYRVTIWTTADGLPENDVTAVVRCVDGQLLVGTNNRGLATFNGTDFRPVPLDANVSPRVYRIMQTAAGTPIVSFLGGVIGAFQDGRIIVERKPASDAERVPWLLEQWIDGDSHGDSFRTHDRSTVCRDVGPGSVTWRLVSHSERTSSPGPRGRAVPPESVGAVDDGGGTWFTTDTGLCHETVDGTIATLDAERLGFDPAAVRSLVADDEGNVWVGLWRQGLARIRATQFRSPPLASGGALAAGAASLCQDAAGAIWVTNPGGAVWRADGTTGENGFKPIVEAVRPPTDDSVITACAAGGVWVATQSAGLFHIGDNGVRKVVDANRFGGVARVMMEVGGTLWIVGRNGLLALDAAGRAAKKVSLAEAFGPEPLLIESLAPAANGGLWVGGSWSRLVHRAADGTCTLHKAPWSQPGNRFWALLSDASIPGREAAGGVWIGTLGHGLVWFDPSTRRFHSFTTAQGLPSDTVCQILSDAAGALWLGTYHGVVRVSLEELAEVIAGRRTRVSCRRFGVDDGLPAAQCSSGRQPGCLAARDGSLWFATDAGVAVTAPATWPAPPPPPRTIIETVTIDGRERAAVGTSPLMLSSGDRRIEFSFAGLWLANPTQVRYRWRIVGIDADWVDGGNGRTARYDRLPPGQHVFEVGAAHVDGLWGDVPTRVAFTIPPFFHETAWFRGLVAVAALAAAAAGSAAWSRQRLRKHQEVAERDRAVEQERTRIAQDLHDDLGASLTEIDFLGALAEHGGAAAGEHLQELRTRAHRTVAALDEIVWAVNPGNDTLGALQGYIADFLQHFLRATSVRCELDLASAPDDLPLPAALRHAVFQATKEAVHNVARHAEATVCRVRLRIVAGSLEVEVVDDGRGFKPEGSDFRRGEGLGNMGARMAAVGGRCELKTVAGGGTQVVLTAPLGAPAQRSLTRELQR